MSDSLDFDQKSPTAGRGYELFLNRTDGVIILGNGRVARWTSKVDPDFAATQDTVTRLGVGANSSFKDIETPFALCLRTGDGRTAFVRLKKIDDDGFYFQATVWEK